MTQEPNSERDLDARLDEALEMTFPASDPVAVHSPDPRRDRQWVRRFTSRLSERW
jgi:hypothetical protein